MLRVFFWFWRFSIWSGSGFQDLKCLSEPWPWFSEFCFGSGSYCSTFCLGSDAHFSFLLTSLGLVLGFRSQGHILGLGLGAWCLSLLLGLTVLHFIWYLCCLGLVGGFRVQSVHSRCLVLGLTDEHFGWGGIFFFLSLGPVLDLVLRVLAWILAYYLNQDSSGSWM